MLRRARSGVRTSAKIRQAVKILQRGGVVAFPTETVYGLGADAENEPGVRRIFELKGRPTSHPLIVHLPSSESLPDWARTVPPLAWQLAEEFWPGPLTLVLPRSPRALDVVTAGLETVALRVPAHPLALALLRAFGGGIAAPSANRFGRVSPTTAAHVRADFGEQLEMILDGGRCRVGVESTIVDLSSGAPAILRPGGVTREALERVAGQTIPVRCGGPVRSPGQLPQHYAPRAQVITVADRAELLPRARGLSARGLRVAVMSRAALRCPQGVVLLSAPPADAQFARRLYALLRSVDQRGLDVVLIELPLERGLGLAIADRLRRAAGLGRRSRRARAP